jgi:predicted nuclease of predicted toxin-antitoxin system
MNLSPYAARNDFVITHDLDFGGLLALSQQSNPTWSRFELTNVFPGAIGKIVVKSLHRSETEAGVPSTRNGSTCGAL